MKTLYKHTRMKKTITLVSLALVIGLVLMDSAKNTAISNTSGAPAGRTGSPADGLNCASSGCHSGTATVSPSQIITSNVPSSGYVPGQTYTITATVSQTGINKFGFQISPQAANGQLLGSLAITNATATKIVSTKYVTHTTAGAAGSNNSRTWSFNWTAPAAGTGDVTFYGAFNYTNGQSNSSGDIVRLNTLTVNEGTGVGIAENSIDNTISVFPNPVVDRIHVKAELKEASNVSIRLMDLNGRLMNVNETFDGTPGTSVYSLEIPSSVPSGVYQLLIETSEGKSLKKIFKQ